MKKTLAVELSFIKSIGFDLRKSIQLASYAYSIATIQYINPESSTFKLSHINELIAVALGYKTYASLKSAMSNGTHVELSPTAHGDISQKITSLNLQVTQDHSEYLAHYFIEHLNLAGFSYQEHTQYYSAIQPIYQHLKVEPFQYMMRSCIEQAQYFGNDHQEFNANQKLPLLALVDVAVLNNMLGQYQYRAERNDTNKNLPLFLQYDEVVSIKFSEKTHQCVSALLSQYNPISKNYWNHTVGKFEPTYQTYYLDYLSGSDGIIAEFERNRMDIYLDLYNLKALVNRSIDTYLATEPEQADTHKTILTTFAKELRQLNPMLADNDESDLENFNSDNEILNYGVKLVLDAIELFNKTNITFPVIPSDFFFSDSGLLMCDFSNAKDLPHYVSFKPDTPYENQYATLSFYDFSIFINIYLVARTCEASHSEIKEPYSALHATMMQMLKDDIMQNSRLLAVVSDLI